jgi:hypothetical protein
MQLSPKSAALATIALTLLGTALPRAAAAQSATTTAVTAHAPVTSSICHPLVALTIANGEGVDSAFFFTGTPVASAQLACVKLDDMTATTAAISAKAKAAAEAKAVNDTWLQWINTQQQPMFYGGG